MTFCWIQNWDFAAQALGQSEKKKTQKTKIQTTLLLLGLAGKQRTTFVTFQRGCEDQNSSVSLDRCHWKLCKPGQSCGTAPGTPLAPEQRAEQRWWFYRLKFSCQSTHNYLQPWGWGCECKKKLTKYHLKPFKRVESLFTHSCLPSFLYHPWNWWIPAEFIIWFPIRRFSFPLGNSVFHQEILFPIKKFGFPSGNAVVH